MGRRQERGGRSRKPRPPWWPVTVPAAVRLRGAVVLPNNKTPGELVGRCYPWVRVLMREDNNAKIVTPYSEAGDAEEVEGARVTLTFGRPGEFGLARRLRARAIRLGIEDGTLRVRQRVRQSVWGWRAYGVVGFASGVFLLGMTARRLFAGSRAPGWTMPAWGWAVVGGLLAMLAAFFGIVVWVWWVLRPVKPAVSEVEVSAAELGLVRDPPASSAWHAWADLRPGGPKRYTSLRFAPRRVRVPIAPLLRDPILLLRAVHLHPEHDPLRPRRTRAWREKLRIAWIIGRTSLPTGAACALVMNQLGPQLGLPAPRVAWAMLVLGAILPAWLALDALLGVWYRPLLARATRRARRAQRRKGLDRQAQAHPARKAPM